ncbi:MAG: ATP-dependent helicase, partial [Lachnospiraceae bacterium]|nr:ATP-dependent helicase [Lachnospiraceae bacterium]
QIVTVHESKGKEYDSVYVWNDTEGVFPSNKCNMESENDLAEERRVHYIACTRAKKKSSIYTLNGKVGLFVREMNCRMTNPVIVKKSI